jgi:BirA family biotin operon repressor/biotin-[acetyl-CoA-carboxylase] ligase
VGDTGGPTESSAQRRKLCGVLTEAVVDEVPVAGKPVDDVLPGTDPENADLSFAVLGIGVNASLDPSNLDVEDREVTTLREEAGDVDPTDVAATLHERLIDWVSTVETDDGFATAVDAFRERSATLGDRVEVTRRNDEPVVGDAISVDERGALVVDTGERRVTVTEGECRRLRRT